MEKYYWRKYFLKFIFAFTLACVVFLNLSCATTTNSKADLDEDKKARMILDIANGALQEGDLTEALRFCLEAEKLDPDFPELYHTKALIYFAKRKKDLAITFAKKAVKIKPDYSAAQNTLGKLLLDEGKYLEAETHLVKAANDPIYNEAFKANTNLGILYYRLGWFDKSEKHLNEAIFTNPKGSCIASYYLGNLDLKKNKYDFAITEYKKAIKGFCTGFGEAHFALGVAYTRNKKYTLARQKFLEIQQRFKNTELAKKALDQLRYLP